ncbi:unknown protein [Desulfotalea psychrophila LSv54]|uniref:Uncharacterized protein n=1 Tax=Desulfotalea psychrophila (strain LSv54 / DSM 12343) TaxID=177439 RepID=Q6ASA7_DESPS|nr:unknown protein [Desulfotalea psychrophila LSv54]
MDIETRPQKNKRRAVSYQLSVKAAQLKSYMLSSQLISRYLPSPCRYASLLPLRYATRCRSLLLHCCHFARHSFAATLLTPLV